MEVIAAQNIQCYTFPLESDDEASTKRNMNIMVRLFSFSFIMGAHIVITAWFLNIMMCFIQVLVRIGIDNHTFIACIRLLCPSLSSEARTMSKPLMVVPSRVASTPGVSPKVIIGSGQKKMKYIQRTTGTQK